MGDRMSDDETVPIVWEKGRVIAGYDAGMWRRDAYGSAMKRTEYGNRDSKYGWETDHINPNGGDGLSNLQPLQWENNVAKSDGRM